MKPPLRIEPTEWDVAPTGYRPGMRVHLLDDRSYIRARSSEDDAGCWVWNGSLDSKGYAKMKRRSIVQKAAPFAYRVFIGQIDAGLEIDHLCRNRACVNPAHLEAVTHLENVRRARRGGPNQCPRGHLLTPENTRNRGHGRECRECLRNLQRLRRATAKALIIRSE